MAGLGIKAAGSGCWDSTPFNDFVNDEDQTLMTPQAEDLRFCWLLHHEPLLLEAVVEHDSYSLSPIFPDLGINKERNPSKVDLESATVFFTWPPRSRGTFFPPFFLNISSFSEWKRSLSSWMCCYIFNDAASHSSVMTEAASLLCSADI